MRVEIVIAIANATGRCHPFPIGLTAPQESRP